MKRFFIATMLLFVVVTMGWAYQDSFAYLWESDVYSNLIRALKDNLDEKTVLSTYDSFMGSGFGTIDKSRVEYHMVRYYVENGNKEKAQEHLENERALFAEIPATETQIKKDFAELDLRASEYFLDKTVGTGLATSNLTKKLFKAYPDEFYMVVTEGYRLLYTPAIAGGSAKDALELFRKVAEEADEMNDLDRFTLYSGLGMACCERKLYDEARTYFDMATGIYKSDAAMEEYLELLEKKGK